VEVDLCGHATLATAYVIWAIRRESSAARLNFHSRGGRLAVDKDRDRYVLDFPSRPPYECKVDTAVTAGLGAQPGQILAARDYLCVFESEEQVRNLTPDMARLAAIDRYAVIATAPGRDCDFVSRFFAPAQGIPEDPVTGSAHCTLIPYWARRLAKTTLFARQVSLRGGELWCEDHGDRVPDRRPCREVSRRGDRIVVWGRLSPPVQRTMFEHCLDSRRICFEGMYS
jgi:PhzF family phenazine biosynthesis protein